jgi:hypothetical protein
MKGGGKKKGVKGKNELPPPLPYWKLVPPADGRDFAFILRSVHAHPPRRRRGEQGAVFH